MDQVENLKLYLRAAEERAGGVQQQLNEERERSERTALPTFLHLCRKLFLEPLRVQTNWLLTTKGSITSPRGRKHSIHLRSWHDFP
jgi:hypothetical protein